MDNTYDFKVPGFTVKVEIIADAIEETKHEEAPVEVASEVAPVADETPSTEGSQAE